MASKIRLNLGCGIWLRRGFINVDKYIDFEKVHEKKGIYKHALIEGKNPKTVKADIKEMPFPNNYADYVELMNTIEHFPMYQIVDYLKEIHRVMKPGGELVILTNNFTGQAIEWLDMVANGVFDVKQYYDIAEVIYGNQYGDSDVAEYHKCPFTKDFMNHVLTQAGFSKGNLFILPKGAKVPTIGTVKPIKKNAITRNSLLIAEVIK